MTENALRQALKQRLDPVTFPEEGRLSVLHRIKGDKPVKKKLSLGLILAFALIAIGLTALALTQTDLLQYLIGSPEQASQALTGIVQPLNIQAEQDGIRVKITGATYDGEKLALSWVTENTQPDRPVTLSIQSASANGQRVYPNFSDLYESWRPMLFSIEDQGFDRNVVTGGMIGLVDGPPLSGEVEMVLNIAISRPKGPLVVVDASLYPDENEDELGRIYRLEKMSRMKESKLAIADQDQLDPSYWISQGYTPLDASGWVQEEDIAMTTDGTQHIYQKTMEESSVIALRFTLDADLGLAQVRSLVTEQKDIKLEDCTVRINRLSLSPLTTKADIDLIPHDGTAESALILQERYGSIMPTSGGKNLDFAEMEFESGGSRHQLKDSTWSYHVFVFMPGQNTFPEEITLSPQWDYFGNKREGDISEEDMGYIEAFEKALTFQVN